MRWRWRATNVCDAWPVRCQTYGYLPIRKASPPIDWYQIILLDDKRHMYVNNLPRVALDSRAAGIRTRVPVDRKSCTLPLRHQATQWTGVGWGGIIFHGGGQT